MSKEVDITTIRYGASLITETGERYILDNAVTSIAWEEQEGQLAAKATITVGADVKVGDKNIRGLLKLNCTLRLYANWGEGKTKLFEGFIWEWAYAHGTQKMLTVTAYDPMIRLQQSKDHKYFSKGMDTKAIIGAICGEWGVPVNYAWAHSITHEKKLFKANAISDMILELLDEVKKQKNAPYITIYRDGKLEINAYGNNSDIFKFRGNQTISTSDKLSMSNLVTRVKILGKADDEGRAKVEATVDGNLDFGILQEILQRDEDKDLGKAKAEAQTIIDENGKPEETITVTAPDLPFLRKGDAVEMKAGNLKGIFYAKGVSHNATTRQMTMTLMRKPEESSTAASTDFNNGDAVILNGAVYRDSYGNGKGRTFSNYKSTITKVVDKSRAKPYHIGTVGWVSADEITKA